MDYRSKLLKGFKSVIKELKGRFPELKFKLQVRDYGHGDELHLVVEKHPKEGGTLRYQVNLVFTDFHGIDSDIRKYKDWQRNLIIHVRSLYCE